jgi:tetratricopeptide (TPR) repeat protein
VILTNLLSRIFSRTAGIPAVAGGGIDGDLQRGYRLQRAGDQAAAERSYRRVLELDSHNADAHYLLGALLGETGNPGEAAIHLDQALVSRPDFAAAHAARGNVFLLLDDRQAAAASYRQALRYEPDNAIAHFNLGLILQASGVRDQALHHFERAYGLAPDIPDLLKNLTLLQLGFARYDEAKSVLQRVLAQTPQHPEALKCMGLTLQKMHSPDLALQCYVSARSIVGADAELLKDLGIVLQDLGRFDEAIASYDAAIALKPDFTLAIWHRSLAYLLRHDFARGWPDYELRLVSEDQPRRPVEFTRWNGGVLAGKTLLVYAEQGLGDEIMFASCLPDAIAASKRCIVECSPKLETLFRRSFPGATVYAALPDKALPGEVVSAGIDVQCPIGSLPLSFRRERADFPRHQGYLRTDPELVATWRSRLAALGPGLKVGISWQGGTHVSRRPVRSVPLTRWLPILQSANAHFIDLQYSDGRAELDALRAATGAYVHSWEEVRTDYEQTAALVASLDLVISVCTAVVHLGGALGRPVWVMAPFGPEWRYGIAGEEMPWYPSVRVFRQPAYGDWDAVIDNVAQSLRRMA